MGVFFGFGNSNLLLALLRQDLPQGIDEVVFVKNHINSLVARSVSRHRRKAKVCDGYHSLGLESALVKGLGQFTATVGAVVKK